MYAANIIMEDQEEEDEKNVQYIDEDQEDHQKEMENKEGDRLGDEDAIVHEEADKDGSWLERQDPAKLGEELSDHRQ
jgi:hypothetical protein